MRYELPNVTLLGSAAAVVQNGEISKGVDLEIDSVRPFDQKTDGVAYQADE